MATDMEKYFATRIDAAKKAFKKAEEEFEATKDDLARWEQAEAAHKNAVEKGEIHRRKAPSIPPEQPAEPSGPTRQNMRVAPVIKEAIQSLPEGKNFTPRDVFEQIAKSSEMLSKIDVGTISKVATNHYKICDYYDKLRPNISSWLQNYAKEQKIEKIDRGVYRLPPKGDDKE